MTEFLKREQEAVARGEKPRSSWWKSNVDTSVSWGDLVEDQLADSEKKLADSEKKPEAAPAAGGKNGVKDCRHKELCTRKGCTFKHPGQKVEPEGKKECRFGQNCASFKEGGLPCNKAHLVPWVPQVTKAPKTEKAPPSDYTPPDGTRACMSADKCKKKASCGFSHPSDPTPPEGVSVCSRLNSCKYAGTCTRWHPRDTQPPTDTAACTFWSGCYSLKNPKHACDKWHPVAAETAAEPAAVPQA